MSEVIQGNGLNIFGSSTYSEDLNLVQELGLNVLDEVDNGEYYLGEVEGDFYTVKVWVTTAPAQFYQFEITDPRGKVIWLNTGSGSLTAYWPSVVLIAQGMLVVKEQR